MINRMLDVVLAVLMIILAVPLLVVSALVVRLTSEGPVLFAHTRCGRHGVPFQCLKLRTMVVDAENWLVRYPHLGEMYRDGGFKLRTGQDPRVTKVGRILRKVHLDELPQLLNVIKGDMSLVGPRPIVEEELDWYGDDRAEYLSVRPGIFGAWTAGGRRRLDYPARTFVELEYIRDIFWLKDVLILLKHIPVLVVGQSDGQVPGRPEMTHEGVSTNE